MHGGQRPGAVWQLYVDRPCIPGGGAEGRVHQLGILKRLGLGIRVAAQGVHLDIEADPAAKDELLEKINGNFQGVPVTDVDGEIVLGFDRKKLSQLIGVN